MLQDFFLISLYVFLLPSTVHLPAKVRMIFFLKIVHFFFYCVYQSISFYYWVLFHYMNVTTIYWFPPPHKTTIWVVSRIWLQWTNYATLLRTLRSISIDMYFLSFFFFSKYLGIKGLYHMIYVYQTFPGGSVVQNPPTSAGHARDTVPSLGQEDPLEQEMGATLVFLPGKSHGHRGLMGCSLWGHKSQTQLNDWTHTNTLASTGHSLLHCQYLPPE